MSAMTQVSGTKVKTDAVMELARALMEVPLGGRIPTVTTLQGELGVGSGTVVKALRTLESLGAVTVEAHGHLGTLLVARDLGLLWDSARLGNLRVLFTPPGPVEQHAVGAALRAAMGEREIPLLIDYVPGARRRLREVARGRAHAAFTSSGAFAQHRQDYPDLVAHDLGDHTYYDRESLVVVGKAGRAGAKPARVGLDQTSDDHTALTLAEFGERVEHVACSFVEGPAGVLQDRFDAVVWHRMPTIIPPELAGLTVRPLSSQDDDAALTGVSRGVLVARASDPAILGLLEEMTPTRIRRYLRKFRTAVGDSLLPHEALWLG
jgi:hypothetical protein